MNKYNVTINGRNFLLRTEEGLVRHGFYATRYVEATNLKDAELKAVDSIRNQDDLKNVVQNNPDDPPMLHLEEISELESFDGINRGIEKGASWYKEGEEAE